DCNPGSSYTTSMPFCIALAVREMEFTPAEAVYAATRGGAAALQRTDLGHLTHGARADLVVLDAPSYLHLAYRPGVPLVSSVVLNGELTLPPRPSPSPQPASSRPTSSRSRGPVPPSSSPM